MVTKLTRAEVQTRLATDRPILVEALGPTYFEDAHLPGAINIPHEHVDDLAPELLPDRDAEIIVYCASTTCRNSELAARRLEQLGYSNVAEYVDGKADWIEAGLPVESGAGVTA
ncbi:MAG: rhodanese-like domain-containing protein [Gaiellaceae bacterium MAG52_C11]|nr:rhodanese-like domain-containing protein [Candidatus Gaiellasilicea maunaloa]